MHALPAALASSQHNALQVLKSTRQTETERPNPVRHTLRLWRQKHGAGRAQTTRTPTNTLHQQHGPSNSSNATSQAEMRNLADNSDMLAVSNKHQSWLPCSTHGHIHACDRKGRATLEQGGCLQQKHMPLKLEPIHSPQARHAEPRAETS